MDSRLNPSTDFVFNESLLMENVVDTLRRLPAYAEHYAKTKGNAERLEQELKNVEARVSLEVRKMTKENKLTENTIQSLVRDNLTTQEALVELTAARQELYYAEGWWRAIQKACDMLQMMGYSRNAEMKRL